MRNIRLTIEYDGTDFNGWQIQKNTSRTIQGLLDKALKKILKEDVKLIGSGRTDRGVHSLGQVANFKTKTQKDLNEIQNALNANIPNTIAVTAIKEAKDSFHAQYSFKTKTYRYCILNRKVRRPQLNRYTLHYPNNLNLNKMKEEAKALVGKKDFQSFQAADSKRKHRSTVRTVKRITIKKTNDLITIDIEANGFLYKMVRNIVGTLIEIGSGKRPKGSMKKILTKKKRSLAGATAKAHGLTLYEVKY